MKLLNRRLYKPVLIKPADNGADTLKIVSGFASPAMALRHLHDLEKTNRAVSIHLILGMAKHAGIDIANHRNFVRIQQQFENFSCRYSLGSVPIHAKVYTWCVKGAPLVCYTGSANYTQNGFACHLQSEVMTETDPKAGLKFFRDSREETADCADESYVEEHIKLYTSDERRQHGQTGLPEKELPLINTRTGETHRRAGLNWGQREARDPNQAYIPVPAAVTRTDFFPEVGQYFTVLTDDSFSFTARIAQEEGKAVHSSESNAIIGEYFRKRLNVESGGYVTRQHLDAYGRTSVTFMKIDDETYFMDFSPNRDEAEQEE